MTSASPLASAFGARVTAAGDREWERIEAELDAQGTPLPLSARAAAVRLLRYDAALVSVHDGGGTARAAIASSPPIRDEHGRAEGHPLTHGLECTFSAVCYWSGSGLWAEDSPFRRSFQF